MSFKRDCSIIFVLLLVQDFFNAMIIPDTRVNVMLKNQQVKLNIRSIESYNKGRLFKMGRTLDGNTILSFIGKIPYTCYHYI